MLSLAKVCFFSFYLRREGVGWVVTRTHSIAICDGGQRKDWQFAAVEAFVVGATLQRRRTKKRFQETPKTKNTLFLAEGGYTNSLFFIYFFSSVFYSVVVCCLLSVVFYLLIVLAFYD